MNSVLQILMGLVGIGSLICYIFVLVRMFTRGDASLAIASIVLLPCAGIGVLIAFGAGWTRVGKYDARPVMILWSVLIVLNVLLWIAVGLTLPQVDA